MALPTLKVLHVASEVTPLSKTGGLADVVGSLPRALTPFGVRSTVVSPCYAGIDAGRWSLARRLRGLTVPVGPTRREVGVVEGRLPGGGPDLFLLDHPPSFARDGIYGDAAGDYPDNAERFALLARGALELVRQLGRWPDVVHAHDWQGALALLYARHEPSLAHLAPPATVLTIHNLAFQGLFPEATCEAVGVPRALWQPAGVEFWGKLSFLKAGLACADRVTTVSPRYAREIQTPEGGCGLEGLLSALGPRLVGILNGIDTARWDPATDRFLPAPYDAHGLEGKAACKAALQKTMGLPARPHLPLFGAISRLTEQKGFELVAAIGDDLARLDAQLVVLGSGDAPLERRLLELARRQGGRVAVRIGYDDALAHQIIAASDLFLVPSRFEPCGLTQLYALRYGTVPIVRAVGGLDDTVVDYDRATRTGTGFKLAEHTPEALLATVRRALVAYGRRDAWGQLVRTAMAQDFSWAISARSYAELYRRVVEERAGGAASAG